MRPRIVFSVTFFCALWCASLVLAQSRWTYVVPESEAFPSPPVRGHWLDSRRPEDVRLSLETAATGARYVQVRYGSPDSVRVTIMVVVVAGKSRLYVDADRDRILGERDFVAGSGPTWRLGLPYERTTAVPLSPRHIDRTVEIRVHRSGRTISTSTVGYLEHEVKLDGRRCSARMVDGDVSGRFGDADDRLWIDLDGDDCWDRFLEQFPSRPIVRVAGTRYALLGDERGERFSLSELTGAGTVELQLATKGRRDPQDYRALLVGVDQTAVSLGKDDGPVAVPVGRYRLATLSVKYDGDDDSPAWNYVFSGSGSGAQWHEVKREKRCVIEPLTGMKLVAKMDDRQTAYRPGDFVIVSPRLYSAAGLMINSCTRGTMQPWQLGRGPSALVQLCQDDTQVAAAQSGFA